MPPCRSGDGGADCLPEYSPRALSEGQSLFLCGQGGWKPEPQHGHRLFQKHSKTITPKTLRQCSPAPPAGKAGATVAEIVELTGADPQTVSLLVKRQAADIRKQL